MVFNPLKSTAEQSLGLLQSILFGDSRQVKYQYSLDAVDWKSSVWGHNFEPDDTRGKKWDSISWEF